MKWLRCCSTRVLKIDKAMNIDKNDNNPYLSEIGAKQQLTDEQEQQLALRIKQGDEKSVDKLMAHNLKYVVTLAAQYKNRGLDIEDLISEGNIGMLKAARKFDGSQHKRFVTFAAPYIRDAIEKAIEQQAGIFRVPRDAKDITLEKKRSKALSIDAPVGGSTELSLGRVIPDKDTVNPENALEEDVAKDELQKLLSTLPQRDQHVMQRFYGLGVETRTMAEIAQEMGLKRERVRQIRDHAIHHILKASSNKHLKAFLKG